MGRPQTRRNNLFRVLHRGRGEKLYVYHTEEGIGTTIASVQVRASRPVQWPGHMYLPLQCTAADVALAAAMRLW